MGFALRIVSEPRVLASGDWTLEPGSPGARHDTYPDSSHDRNVVGGDR